MEIETIAITVSGKVQGVYFRHYSREMARDLGVTGTVQNLANGDVQIIVTGKPADLEALIAWCHIGPNRAKVDKVIVNKQSVITFESFKII